MKKSMKIVGLVLAILMVFALVAACSQPQESPSQETDSASASVAPSESADTASAQPASEEGKPLPEGGLICYSGTSLSYYFFVAEQEAARRAVEALGYEFEAAAAEFESVTENNNLNNFIAKNPVAIIADPADTDGIIAPLDKAQEAGIPVAVIDATVGAGGTAGITITFDNYGAGFAAGEEIARLLKEKYGEYKGRVLNAYGIQNNEAIRNRRQGFVDAINQYPDIELVETPGEGNMDDTMNAALNALAQYGSFDAMHAPSDSPCMGLYEALKKTDNLFKVGEDGHVILVTIDGEPIALERIKEGYYDSTINQDAVAYAEIAVEMLEKYLLRGLPVPVGTTYESDRYIWGKSDIVESENGPMLVVPHTVVNLQEGNIDDPRLWGNIAQNELGVTY